MYTRGDKITYRGINYHNAKFTGNFERTEVVEGKIVDCISVGFPVAETFYEVIGREGCRHLIPVGDDKYISLVS